jgi:UDP-N-acetylmuramoyl-L-alanyl-D-glutamate--2,6-diaminopimelate ligase
VDDLKDSQLPLPHKKNLGDLLSFLGVHGSERPISAGIEVLDITSSSQLVTDGSVFLALAGERAHGAKFVADVISQGAAAIITDAAGSELIKKDSSSLPQSNLVSSSIPIFSVSKPEVDLGHLAHWFYDYPMYSIYSAGITGTNGKTTTTTLLYQLWQGAGLIAGLMGTISTRFPGYEITSSHTTPSADHIARSVAAMRDLHVQALAMEVSSHGLALHRLNGSRFAAVGFTNLSQDHLDFHKDIESYFQVKAKLFSREFSDKAFINIDNPYGKRLAEQTNIEVSSISLTQKKATWFLESKIARRGGFALSIRGPEGVLIETEINLIGLHNVENYLMALAFAFDSGVDPLVLADISPQLKGAIGRLEEINLGQPFGAYIDYAHTPDAVERILQTLRGDCQGRIIAVLGCGGDRDKSKRPLMGQSLFKGSDIAIFTSDNPRSEDPNAILEEMVADLKLEHPSIIEPDRAAAIAYAVSIARDKDLVIVLGKGHEKGQEIAGVIHSFDDRTEVARAIEGSIEGRK